MTDFNNHTQQDENLTFLVLIQAFLLLINSGLYKLAWLLINNDQKNNQLMEESDIFIVETIQSIDELIKNLRMTIKTQEKDLDTEIQRELSSLLKLCINMKNLIYTDQYSTPQNRKKIHGMIPNLKIAFCSFNKNKNIDLVTRIRKDIESTLSQIKQSTMIANASHHFLEGVSTPAKVLTGLFLALPIHLCAPVILSILLANAKVHVQPIFIVPSTLPSATISQPSQASEPVNKKVSQQEIDEFFALLLLSAIAGSSGSVISIISRLNEYQTREYGNTLFPVFVGAFKPMIGAFMGMFLFAFLNAKMLPILIPEEPASKWFAVMSLTFLIGFSERFANDLISQAENKVSNNSQEKENS